MPQEAIDFEHNESPFRCPNCHEFFEPFLRGQVHRTLFFIFPWPGRFYSCLICRACKEIIGHEGYDGWELRRKFRR